MKRTWTVRDEKGHKKRVPEYFHGYKMHASFNVVARMIAQDLSELQAVLNWAVLTELHGAGPVPVVGATQWRALSSRLLAVEAY